ncbi:hypothetical protein [Streptomyces sp. NPDC091268]|uniref:hypothetical protein n=1 Tax=Streptomyces sp. NPDC091268 TaxID=3365979 RepID=UPI0037F51AA9
MRNTARPPGRRRFGSWTRFLTTTAVATAAAVTFSGSGLQPPADSLDSARPAAASELDLDAAKKVRDAQCLLGNVLRKGGTEMKAVARAGLNGTNEQLLAAAAPNYWETTPLSTAYDKDHKSADDKFAEMEERNKAWQASLYMLDVPPGYTYTGFQWPPNPTIFTETGFAGWIADRFWTGEDDHYGDPHPLAGQQSIDAVTAIANARYYPNGSYEDRSAWEWDMQHGHTMYADDARMFLENGGFPTSAPEPDSMEFRVDVENLKARFASCATSNPVDPHQVLTAEVAVATQEWQNEIAGQRVQRDAILGAEQAASKDLQTAAQAMAEALGQSLIASRLADWEAYFLKVPAGSGRPSTAEFTKARTWIEQAKARATGRLYVASRAAEDAQTQAAAVTAAQTAAYQIADQEGLPRGRGLLYGQQAAQITKASAAAALAAAKATETALNATRASAADSKTLNSLAMTQAHASKAEFRRKAAQEAEAQAKASAEGAAAQAVKAAENAAKAKAAQVKAAQAEATAKTAADDAKAKREKAEAERDYAKSQKELAESERGKAAAAESTAQNQRRIAAEKLTATQAAGRTAGEQKDAALKAEQEAVSARDDALDAETRRDALNAQAAAAESQAAADEGTSAAGASRAAATTARAAANDATSAATAARAAANTATTAASNARAAATRAEGAAKRAQSAADAAKADVAITDAAVTKAHAAAAEAIDASWQASWNAVTAKAQADTAKANAAKAKADAAMARTEALAAGAESIRTAGFAYSTAQAAAAARDSAAQVIKPANDAIEMGSPYKETDASAGLAVLTGQAAKTAADRQAAVAQAKSAQAAKAAAEAKALAAQADADAKVAAEAAASAADWAAKAAASAAAAQASANEAAASAKAAKASEAKTVAYHERATADAAAAQSAATTADGYANAADSAATDAERDAASARTAASGAEADAGAARTIATQAEKDATTAEAAAEHAQEAADQAQVIAKESESWKAEEKQAKSAAVSSDGQGVTGEGVVWVSSLRDAPEPISDCVGTGGCDITFRHHVTGAVVYLLLMCDLPEVPLGDCIGNISSEYLMQVPIDVTHDKVEHIAGRDLAEAAVKGIVHALLDDIKGCFWDLQLSSCAWVAAEFAIPGILGLLCKAVVGMRAAIRAGRALAAFEAEMASLGASAAAIKNVTGGLKVSELVAAEMKKALDVGKLRGFNNKEFGLKLWENTTGRGPVNAEGAYEMMNLKHLADVKKLFTKDDITKVRDAYAEVHRLRPYHPTATPKGNKSAGPRADLMDWLLQHWDDVP